MRVHRAGFARAKRCRSQPLTRAHAHAILLGAIGLPEARHPDGREVNGDVIFRLRFDLDLYAGVRPIKAFRGTPPTLAHGKEIDYVIVRENTEGLYASSTGGTNVRGEVATDTLGSRRMAPGRSPRWPSASPRDGRADRWMADVSLRAQTRRTC